MEKNLVKNLSDDIFYNDAGYSDVYINYLKNNKNSTMSETDVYKHYKKMYGTITDDIKDNVNTIKNAREEEYKKYVKNLGGYIPNESKEFVKKTIIQMYPYEEIFKHQF